MRTYTNYTTLTERQSNVINNMTSIEIDRRHSSFPMVAESDIAAAIDEYRSYVTLERE